MENKCLKKKLRFYVICQMRHSALLQEANVELEQ